MPENHVLCTVPFNHVKGSFEPTRECKYKINHCFVIRCIFHETRASIRNYRPSLMYMYFCFYRTGYIKKAHYRHLPVVFSHSTLNEQSVWSHSDILILLNVPNRRDENCDNILPFWLPNDVMLKIW